MGHGKKPEGEKKIAAKGKSFRKRFLTFLALFFLIWLLSYFITRKYPVIEEKLISIVVSEVSLFLNLFNYKYKLEGPSFTFYARHGCENMIVVVECTGLYTTIIFYSIILAYPAKIYQKLLGLLIGIPAIHILNLLRMIVISLILYHNRDLFTFFHGYLWQITFVIFMLLLVILWMGKIVKRNDKDE